jgi:translation initiation factor eIF-2B subunit delta
MSTMSLPPQSSASQPNGTQHRSQKSMTKAERRELQEQQRAAKAAAKAAAASGTSQNLTTSSTKQPGKQSVGPATPGTSGQGRKPPKGVAAESTKQGKDATGAGYDDVGMPQTHGVKIFSHFGAQQKTSTSKGNIHPAIVRLGLLFAEFKITGANARCIATLTAFKNVCPCRFHSSFLVNDIFQVIQDYSTPPNNTLSRHLMTHLSSQISYLVAARPMSVTMGNAIRQLKLEISGSDIDLPEQDVC